MVEPQNPTFAATQTQQADDGKTEIVKMVNLALQNVVFKQRASLLSDTPSTNTETRTHGQTQQHTQESVDEDDDSLPPPLVDNSSSDEDEYDDMPDLESDSDSDDDDNNQNYQVQTFQVRIVGGNVPRRSAVSREQ